jgi:hypothetical protein
MGMRQTLGLLVVLGSSAVGIFVLQNGQQDAQRVESEALEGPMSEGPVDELTEPSDADTAVVEEPPLDSVSTTSVTSLTVAAAPNELRTIADLEAQVKAAISRIVTDIVPADEERPFGDMTVQFVDGINVHTAPDPSPFGDWYNQHTTYLRSLLPSRESFANGCADVSLDQVTALEHFPKDPGTSADLLTDELRLELIELYRDESVRADILSRIGNPNDGAVAMDELVRLFENETYHPLAVFHICYAQGQLSVAAVSNLAFFAGQTMDPVLLHWNGAGFDRFTLPLGFGPITQYAFLPAASTHADLIFSEEQIPATDVRVWFFYELKKERAAFVEKEACVGTDVPKAIDKSGTFAVITQSDFVFGCSPEFGP